MNKKSLEDGKKKGVRNRLAWIEPLLLLVIVAGVFVLFYQLGLWRFFRSQKRIVDFLDSMGVWDETGFIFLEAIQVIIPAVPGMLLNVLGGYLYGTVAGVILSTIGTTIGGYIVYLLSRRFRSFFINKFFNKDLMRRFGNIPRNKGRFTIFLFFLVPGFPKDYLCYTLGYLSAIEFLLITTTGRLLGTVMETLGGNYIRHKRYQELAVLVGIAFIIIAFVYIYRSRIERLLRMVHIMGYRKKKAGQINRKIGKPGRITHV